jgi:hypothetical protein
MQMKRLAVVLAAMVLVAATLAIAGENKDTLISIVKQ